MNWPNLSQIPPSMRSVASTQSVAAPRRDDWVLAVQPKLGSAKTARSRSDQQAHVKRFKWPD